jgi:hypothetical protein
MNLSRRDCMKVAWHEVPGTAQPWIRPVGYGMGSGYRIVTSESTQARSRLRLLQSYRTLRDGSCLLWYQALRARLPSCRPFGTQKLVPVPTSVLSCPNPGLLPPLQHLQRRDREVQFGLGAVLQNSATPTPLFEHEHEHDFDAPGEGGSVFANNPGSKPRAKCYFPFLLRHPELRRTGRDKSGLESSSKTTVSG